LKSRIVISYSINKLTYLLTNIIIITVIIIINVVIIIIEKRSDHRGTYPESARKPFNVKPPHCGQFLVEFDNTFLKWPLSILLECLLHHLPQRLRLQTTTNEHPFNSLFSTTTWVSWHHIGKTILDFNEATDDGVVEASAAVLDHMQITCTSLQTDNHASTSSLNFYSPDDLPDPQPCQSTEGKYE